MNKKCFTFLESFYETVQALPEGMQVGATNAIIRYGLYGELPEDPIMLAIVTALKAPIDDGNEIREKRREAGSKPKQKETNGNKTEQTETNGNKEKEKEKEKGNIKEKERKKEKDRRAVARFSPPTADEVRAYCSERGYSVNAERFVAFYESNGWRVGKNSMKDWKAAVRTWAHRDDDTRKSKAEHPPNRFHNFDERRLDYDAMLKGAM